MSSVAYVIVGVGDMNNRMHRLNEANAACNHSISFNLLTFHKFAVL